MAHLPAGDALGGVVICPPIFEEFQSNFHREVLLARELVARDIAVYRFHYRGTGNSGPPPQELTLASMTEDSIEVVAHLKDRTGDVPIGYLGTRLGAIAAAGAAGATGAEGFASWEPALDAERHLREILRAQRLRELVATSDDRTGTDPLSEVDGFDVAGYSLPRSLLDSAKGSGLVRSLAGVSNIFLLQLGRRGVPRAALVNTADRLREEGAKVDLEAVVAEETWWFSNDPTKTRAISTKIAARTAEWFEGVLA
jgi:alpha/beta superfamily hydrolase